MRKKLPVAALVIIPFLFLTACGGTQATFYLLSPANTGELKKIGCEEYLMPVKEKLKGDAKLKDVLQLLLSADPKKYGKDLLTATAFSDNFIQLDEVIEKDSPTSDPIEIRLKRNPAKGIAGVCDVPRVKEQINATVRDYSDASQKSFMIKLDGDTKKWKCFGDESGTCK